VCFFKRPLAWLPSRAVVLDLLSKREREFLRHSHRAVYHAFFSWDDKWVVFKTVDKNRRWQIVIAPVRSGTVSAEAEWISVTDGRHADDMAQFSPDGNQIYFTSDRDGYLCLWAQPLDHETKRPIGTAHAVIPHPTF
jgi:Tol biopolymer transport system component